MSAHASLLGVGLATALGRDAAETTARLHAGARAFSPSHLTSPFFPEMLVCEASWLASASPSRSAALAERAATEALADAGVDPRVEPVELIVGASLGGMHESELELARWFAGELRDLPPELLGCHGVHAVAEHLAAVVGPFSRVTTLSSACSSGALALGLAMGRVARGDAELVLAGGVDALARITMLGFHALGAIDPRGAHPFDEGRRGLGLGEGAGFVLLGARSPRRGVYLAGFSAKSEAFHATQPEPSGIMIDELASAALASAGLHAGDVGYVSAHGTGTPHNDAIEAAAISRVFGAGVPVSSQKGALGHTLAACGAVEACIAADVVETGRLPPSPAEAPLAGVSLVDRPGLRADVRASVSHSFGFGGTGAVVVMSRDPGVAPRASFGVGVTAAAALGPDGLLVGPALSCALDPSPLTPSAPRARPSPLRRVDPASAMAVSLASELLEQRRPPQTRTAVVVATAFGVPDAACAFIARALERGPKLVPPMDFPHLVPSAPASNVAIALRLHGPALTVSDLSVGPCAALSIAAELVALDLADAVVVVAVEPESRVCSALLTPRVSGFERRGWGGAAVLVERDAAVRLADAAVARRQLPALPPRAARHLAWSRQGDVEGWGAAPTLLGVRAGAHEASAAFAVAVLAQAVLDGRVDEVRVDDNTQRAHGRVVLSR